MKATIKVTYAGNLNPKLDKKIRRAMESGGFTSTGEGYDLIHDVRDITFEEKD